MQTALEHLRLKEDVHKAFPWPNACYGWRSSLTVTIPREKHIDAVALVQQWSCKRLAIIHDLRILLWKLFHIAQSCPPAQFIVTCMLHDHSPSMPPHGIYSWIEVSIRIYIFLFTYLLKTNGIYIISPESRQPVRLPVDGCTSGGEALCQQEAYCTVVSQHVLDMQWPICQMQALNSLVVIRKWAHRLRGCLIYLQSESAMAKVIFQVVRGRDPFIQACACM